MNTLPTNAQVQTGMGLGRQQLLATLVLLALLAVMVVVLLGAAYYTGSMTTPSAESFAPLAGATRCPNGCPI
jgi:hypothetical protein